MNRQRRVIGLAACLLFASACSSKEPASEGASDSATDAAVEAEGARPPQFPATPPNDAERSPSGLAWQVLTPGSGEGNPKMWDTVTMNFALYRPDGTELATTASAGGVKPMRLNNRMFPGWREGVATMVPGEKRRFWIPGALAYGEVGAANVAPEFPLGPLVLDLELLSFEPADDLPKFPADGAAPPPNARKLDAGVRMVRLKRGTSKKRPKKGSRVTIRYVGWTQDGELFGSSDLDKKRAILFLENAIPGWQIALPQMNVGGSYRVWVPESQAFPEQPGSPQGDLVYDIEVIDVTPVPELEDAAPSGDEKPANGDE
ncbi:MAG: FKBP-type peptidyl-prolyl cis-trans isomerase [Myxococcota bacterium]